ncbi:Uncharacterised protein [Streptococcus pneumoniae]|nr:Uncharacterised protein [Streptococcus pneumoniae]
MTGLSTSLSKRLLRTCPIPSGGAISVLALFRVISIGTMKLASTATRAAAKVPIIGYTRKQQFSYCYLVPFDVGKGHWQRGQRLG